MSINHPNSIWTEAIIAAVRKGWESGMSGGAIAALIHSKHGVTVSRNAVIGKVSRLRLSCRKTASRKSYPKRDRPTANHRVVFVPPKLDVVPVPPDDAVTAKSVHIADLEPHHCRWVMGEPRQTMFCGCEKVPGLPYCAGHAQRAYMQPRVHHHDRQRELVDVWARLEIDVWARLERLEEHCRLAKEQRERTDADRPYRQSQGLQNRQEDRAAGEISEGQISVGAYSRSQET